MQQKIAAVNFGIAAHVDAYLESIELPFGMRQLARGNGAIVDEIVLGTGFVDNSARECERRGGS